VLYGVSRSGCRGEERASLRQRGEDEAGRNDSGSTHISEIRYSILESYSDEAADACGEFRWSWLMWLRCGITRAGRTKGNPPPAWAPVDSAGMPTRCSPQLQGRQGHCRNLQSYDIDARRLSAAKFDVRSSRADSLDLNKPPPRRSSSPASRRTASRAVQCNREDQKLGLIQVDASYFVFHLRWSVRKLRWKGALHILDSCNSTPAPLSKSCTTANEPADSSSHTAVYVQSRMH
jgi:hypothetical protein